MARYASPLEARQLASSWSNQHLTCRLKRHRFTVPIAAIRNTRHKFIFTREGCEGGCGVELWQEMTYSGRVYWRRYDYTNAPGYLSEHGRINGDAMNVVRAAYYSGLTMETTARVKVPKRAGRDA